MESANQNIGSSSSSSSSSSSCFGAGTTPHAWTTAPTSILNTSGPIGSSYAGETSFDSREPRLQENPPFLSSQYSSMPPGMTFHWGNPSFSLNNQSAQDLQLSRIKEELSDHYYRKYNEILSSSSSSSSMDESSGLIIRSAEERNLHSDDDLATKLLLKSFTSGNLLDKNQLSLGELYPSNGAANCGRLGLSQIFPSINVSNLNQAESIQSMNPSCLDINLEALDLLASSRFNGNIGPSSQNQIGMLRDGFMNYGFDHTLQSQQIPLYSSNKIPSSASSNGVLLDAKRSSSSSSKIELKAPLQSAPKKSRLEARTSCPPFKVRKEKLGDRIAALQQLVAPFGKTDTASVLMEAIGYIKFLQNQVETLSVPYMKAASRNKSTRSSMLKAGGDVESYGSEDHQTTRRDLKSRGLCLVPLSCLSYITDGGGVVWPPSHFGGGAT